MDGVRHHIHDAEAVPGVTEMPLTNEKPGTSSTRDSGRATPRDLCQNAWLRLPTRSFSPMDLRAHARRRSGSRRAPATRRTTKGVDRMARKGRKKKNSGSGGPWGHLIAELFLLTMMVSQLASEVHHMIK
jgi:hypothetical protein